MNTSVNTVWNQPGTARFAGVVAAITDEVAMQCFLRDVMTEKEIIEVSARLQAADMLSRGEKYADIIAATKLSSRTVARISDWLQNGTGGYRQVLETEHHSHLPPARA